MLLQMYTYTRSSVMRFLLFYNVIYLLQLVSFNENVNGESGSPDREEFGGFGIVINGHSLVSFIAIRISQLDWVCTGTCMCPFAPHTVN